MQMATVSRNLDEGPQQPQQSCVLQAGDWYAAYTAANHEKKVAAELERRSMQYFLPLYSSYRRWKDRRVKLAMPLFPGYLFVRFAWQDRLRALQIPGLVRFVGFGCGAVVVAESEIVRIRNILDHGQHAEPHPYLKTGRRVRVRSGPLAELEGTVVKRKSKTRLIVSFDSIQRSVAIEVSEEELEPMLSTHRSA
jgi:transcriptional antiterminator NusG